MPILMYTQIMQPLIHITMVMFKYPNVIQTRLHINTCIMKIHGCHMMNISSRGMVHTPTAATPTLL